MTLPLAPEKVWRAVQERKKQSWRSFNCTKPIKKRDFRSDPKGLWFGATLRLAQDRPCRCRGAILASCRALERTPGKEASAKHGVKPFATVCSLFQIQLPKTSVMILLKREQCEV